MPFMRSYTFVSYCVQELISFATTHGGREHLNAVETVMANALYSGPTGSTILNARDAEELSNLYIKVDLFLFSI